MVENNSSSYTPSTVMGSMPEYRAKICGPVSSVLGHGSPAGTNTSMPLLDASWRDDHATLASNVGPSLESNMCFGVRPRSMNVRDVRATSTSMPSR